MGPAAPAPMPLDAADTPGRPESPSAEPLGPSPRAAAAGSGSGRSAVAGPPSDRELLVRALAQREAGDLEACRATLEALLSRVPDYPGAASLLAQVEEQLWLQSALPMVFQARHKHRIGSCEGRLTLDKEGLVFLSEKHGTWDWPFSEIREMERKDVAEIQIRTEEKDVFRLGGAKKYLFKLVDRGLSEEDWERYKRLFR